MDVAIADLCDKLTTAKRDGHNDWAGWFSGEDYAQVFKDGQIVLYISDCYTAWNPKVLKDTLNVDVVINMIGGSEIDDWHGARYHWDQDRASEEEGGWNAEQYMIDHDGEVAGRERILAIQRFMEAPAKFYEDLGIHYIEEASIDNDWHSMTPHIHAVNTRLLALLDARHDSEPSSFDKGCVSSSRPRPREPPKALLFHCYAGRNRSAVALAGFWFKWKALQSNVESMQSMADIILQLAAARNVVLTRKDRHHWHFIEELLKYEQQVRGGSHLSSLSPGPDDMQ